ncbi:enoyl-CoA hydratase/isomerase family protein [Thermomonospora catenispora]|uniref:enoyl-CoA hydratase/isomerase family protein n=1 Tax=Thermomonospora catenispora TaxID=2493090 RepID=UPI0011203B55|nr:enoyl-CoA hydratase/isomerase family protein [Thermomonospora catenispora]TNY38291.1 enoyl-CoA hydratase/isomerase family protein [Thermomonospora catenispora]
MGYRTLELQEGEGRVTVRLDRPERRNAIDLEMVRELHAVCEELEREPRVMILTGGTDGVFAAGADIGQLLRRGAADALAGINLKIFQRIRELPMPTVAAVDGHALGGGAELAYACDLRIATDRAVFGQPEAALGIIAGAGATWRLPRLVGESLAKEMLLAGRRLDAEEARRFGLVTAVVPPERLLEEANALVDRMLRNGPLALRLSKLAVDAPEGAHPALELVAQAVLFESADKRERMTAFLNRRRR